MRRQFEGAVLQAQQASALRAAVLERRLEAASSELSLAQQASMAGGLAGSGSSSSGRQGSAAALATEGSKAKLAAQQGNVEGSSSSSRRGSQGEPSAAGAGTGSSSDWVKTLLQAALHTPLPDQEAALIEDDAPGEILQHIAQLEAAAASGGEELGAGRAVAVAAGAL
jgi:hypothetical protein